MAQWKQESGPKIGIRDYMLGRLCILYDVYIYYICAWKPILSLIFYWNLNLTKEIVDLHHSFSLKLFQSNRFRKAVKLRTILA